MLTWRALQSGGGLWQLSCSVTGQSGGGWVSLGCGAGASGLGLLQWPCRPQLWQAGLRQGNPLPFLGGPAALLLPPTASVLCLSSLRHCQSITRRLIIIAGVGHSEQDLHSAQRMCVTLSSITACLTLHVITQQQIPVGLRLCLQIKHSRQDVGTAIFPYALTLQWCIPSVVSELSNR